MKNDIIALRIDDIGASAKVFEQYSKRRFGNILFLKRTAAFKAWGPYREMSGADWEGVFALLRRFCAKLTVAITATWVEHDGSLTPFPKKFPEEAAALKSGLAQGLLEIANHGLTHCILEKKQFLPRLFSGNRSAWREFWPHLDEKLHYDHLRRAQDILQDTFQTPITTLVPPGNVFSPTTVAAAARCGLKRLNCNTTVDTSLPIPVLDNRYVAPFHDKELVESGLVWLECLLEQHSSKRFMFVKELG